MSYAWNKLRLAVHCLAEARSQRERLAAAIADHLVCLRPKDLPSSWRPEFTAVMNRFDFRWIREQDVAIKQIIDALDDDEVGAVIGSILCLYDAVARYQPIQPAEEVPESATAPRLLGRRFMKDPSKNILD